MNRDVMDDKQIKLDDKDDKLAMENDIFRSNLAFLKKIVPLRYSEL